MKTIYLARHAEAVPVGTAGVYHDFDRPLTPYGEMLLQRQAQTLAQLAPDLQACYASPLLRTQQTAQLLLAGRDVSISPVDALGASPSLSAMQRLLQQTEATQILLVTHQPFVVSLLSWLLTAEQDLNTAFEPGTLACFQLFQLAPRPAGLLQWLMSAEIMAKLA